VTVRVVSRDDAEAKVWATALEVSRVFADVSWVLVGAQMVMLLEREAGRPSGRTTRDVDAIVDVRVLEGGTRAAAERLVAAGYQLASAEHPYRFVRGTAQVDLLAPDHLGAQTDLTTIPPLTTAAIPGGSRALATRRVLEVDLVGFGSGELPVPSLGGAIALKVRAWHARHAERDAQDLVRLLSLVIDVDTVRRDLKRAERRGLGRIAPLGDAASPAWGAVLDPDDAQAAFARLSD
jgi:predicted nucleotidyltransferase